ncbi:hypothetical protein BJ138DRAFT_205666 [Hygrophoropsis aurantiaca]|uniref:Uncharacterized protein n=1 Tax=Hygrophoropsis aurantiaca TaxID=72124 RepID=A0ACB8AAG7_9AGAM|nr:hypothetical protein BJ138DRAFT_205666 [Hygrophoropsis aurantiaca]
MLNRKSLREARTRRPDGPLVVYPCEWDSQRKTCNWWVEGDRKAMGQHLNNEHGISTIDKGTIRCLWDSCIESTRGDNMARHVLSNTHLNTKVKCLGCHGEYAREDSWQRHAERLPNCLAVGWAHSVGASGKSIPEGSVFELHLPLNWNLGLLPESLSSTNSSTSTPP